MLGQNMITCSHYEPDFDAPRSASTRIVLAAGEESQGQTASRTPSRRSYARSWLRGREGREDEHAVHRQFIIIGALSRARPVNLAAALRHHARDPSRPLVTLG